MRVFDVFTPGKLPELTYIDDHLKERAVQLSDSLAAGATVVSLSGPSKSGKTVFIEKNVGKDRLIQITGAGVDGPEKLWGRVFDLIGTSIDQEVSKHSNVDIGLSGELSAQAGFLVSGKGKVGTSGTWSKGEETREKASIDYLQLLIREVKDTNLVIFIDDFHYINKDAQAEIANQIKEAVRQGLIFICASVPYHSDDAIRANSDLRGRMIKLDFDYWNSVELSKIANKGFDELKITIAEDKIRHLADEAAGSPQLMQALCLNVCLESGIREKQDELKEIILTDDLFQKVCTRTALMCDYSSIVDKMKEGPKTRGKDRKGYRLKDSSVADVYPLIVKAVSLDPPELTLRYSNLQRRIAGLCESEEPSGSSVTSACNHMCAIANEADNRTIVEWDGDNDVLDILDPYLLFYLRWAQ